MKPEFRIGDKVIAIGQTHGWGEVAEGDEGVIMNVSPSVIIVNFPVQHGWSAQSKDLRLVKPEVKLPEDLFEL